jgi:predicted anti-sigma-YlaC factor YlaD
MLRSLTLVLLSVFVFTTLSGCAIRPWITNTLADEWASQNQAPEDDLVLARESSAFYLKLSEGLLRANPGHRALAESVASGFTQYAFAFVAFDAERLELQDTRGAQKLRERAARLYLRAHRHAMAALELLHPGFAQALASSRQTSELVLDRADVGLAYWAAASWGGFISLSKDDPNTVANLPLAIRLASLAWHLNPGYGDGSLASLMGSFEASRPNGSNLVAEQYFDQAITLGGANNSGALLAKAENIALPAGDRVAFEKLLRQALSNSKQRGDLQNAVMYERAQWLLDRVDDLF